jgi:hypothetical protein
MIHSIDFILMILSIIAVLLFIFGLYTSPRSSVESAHLIMGGEFTFLFWTLAVGVGILFPLALEVYELLPHFIKQVTIREHNPWLSGVVATSILLGGFMLRYVVVYAGQIAQVILASFITFLKFFFADICVVSPTNRNLSPRVSEGHFRQDLYYRLRFFQGQGFNFWASLPTPEKEEFS